MTITKNLRRVIAGSAVAFLLIGCSQTDLVSCDQGLREEKKSLDSKFKAAVLDVQCGATTRDASWVLLADGDSEFSYEKDRIATFEGRVDRVAWEGGSLVIFYGDAVPFAKNDSARGIPISYRRGE